MEYVELHCKSNFSFLEGASHADELFQRAAELEYRGLAITDRNSLAGVVRAFSAAKDAPSVRLIVGAELHPVDGPPIVVWPQDKAAYARLSRLITRARLRREKGASQLYWQDIAELNAGLNAGILLQQPVIDQLPPADMQFFDEQQALPWEVTERGGVNHQLDSHCDDFRSSSNLEAVLGAQSDGISRPPLGPLEFDPLDDAAWLQWLGVFNDIFRERGSLLTEFHLGVDDSAKLARYRWLSLHSNVRTLAAQGAQYHIPERAILHDCLLATRFATTINDITTQRLGNSQFHLRTKDRLRAIYRDIPEALSRTREVAEQCSFDLQELRYDYPIELAPDGQSPMEYLKRLAWDGAKHRYPQGVPPRVIEMLRYECNLIEELHYEAYFLTVWDLVRYARERGILCQGRGSAANSAVCYCLGVTSVDPSQLDLLFERFISRERNEAPDIDVDFEHQRREEVLQYIYEKYGRHRAGMTATVITYRTKSAIRDCGRALGISLDQIDSLSKLFDSRLSDVGLREYSEQCGIDPASDVGRRFIYLVESLIGFPRHLSQHTGGMVMTDSWLCELCPLENASMDGRTVIQWNKDDLDELGILKVDCLALGMLSAIRRSLEMIDQHYGNRLTLATIPSEDPAVYDMICRADTIGVFQIESRAQMSMLPRLQPRCFYDLVIEVAIVRPGPIQGQMVHPYLQARKTGTQPTYPTDEIRQVLSRTMGVPIFQEQAMRLAVVAAGFTPGEADQLRRAMGAWRRPGVIDQFRQKLLAGMKERGLSEKFAEQVFTQIRGFGEYGFPESHAASFALLVYVSCWIKHHYPAVFCAALLNSQPMGFYAPAQLVRDAKEHGVEVRCVDVNDSHWDTTLERNEDHYAIRLGLRQIRGLPQEVGMQIASQRQSGGIFHDLAEFTRRTQLGRAMITRLADAGALQNLTGDRRAAYWQALGQEKQPKSFALFEAAGVCDDEPIPDSLKPMQEIEEVYADYQTTGLSLRAHPISFVRSQLNRLRVTAASELKSLIDGRFVHVAGLVLMRQRPSTAKGITFVTLEDETGVINLVVKQEIWQRHYKVARRSNAWLAHGVLEIRDGIIHLVVGRIEDLSEQVEGLQIRSRDFH
ncbi:MAG: error-prone DNA polymerase [Planctomycetales bacterium]|nr:error-prone DNA polymerase [Planctomycetales bacterium]